MPGGVLFEVATCNIGFFIDETPENLGQRIQFAPWFEDRRDQYLAQLEQITWSTQHIASGNGGLPPSIPSDDGETLYD